MRLACSAPLHVSGLLAADKGGTHLPPDVAVELVGASADGPALLDTAPVGRIVEPSGGWLEVTPVSSGGGAAVLRFGYSDEHVQFDIGPAGAEIVVRWSPAVLPAHVGTLLLGTVLGYLLHVRGRPALHAGVVARGGVAYAFAGASGAGKSTTIGALARRGCAVVSDDVAALGGGPEGWAVFPGLAGVRLAPDVLDRFGVPDGGATPVWPAPPSMADTAFAQVEGKAVVAEVGSGGGGSPVRLAGIFLLPPRSDDIAAPRVVDLSPAAAVPALTSHVLTPAWVPRRVDGDRFLALADLARTTPVRVVERPDRLDALPAMCDAVLDEMARLR